MLVAEYIWSLYYLPACLRYRLHNYSCTVLLENYQYLWIRRKNPSLVLSNNQYLVQSKNAQALGLIAFPTPIVIPAVIVKEQAVTIQLILSKIIADYKMVAVGNIDDSFSLAQSFFFANLPLINSISIVICLYFSGVDKILFILCLFIRPDHTLKGSYYKPW